VHVSEAADVVGDAQADWQGVDIELRGRTLEVRVEAKTL
jgi:hypothetical protein